MTDSSPEEIALKRIQEATQVKATTLRLVDISLTKLPIEIEQLTNLTSLTLSYNQFSTLPKEVFQLKNLKELFLLGNSLTILPKEIGQLTHLTTLYLTDNNLSSLPPEIGKLTQLTTLDINNNKLTALPKEIGQLINLKEFYLYGNSLNTLPKEVAQLVNLISFELTNNSISVLPEELSQLVNLRELWLGGNPLPIPPEILEKNKEARVILEYYFPSRRKALNEVKAIIIGQGSVGKTSVVERIMKGGFNQDQTKTEGISINEWQVEDIRLNIWDFGGQEIMHATHQFFLTKRSLYLLALDSRLTQEENRVEYWLKIIQSFGGESPVLIVGNKTDQHPLDIDRTGLQKKYPNIVGILETSAATGAGIEELKAAIAEQVNNLPHVRDLLPETWFTVKTKLEGLGRESNFITHDKYLDLCTENEVSDETSQRTLIGFLRDLGVILYFQDDYRLSELGILSPQWVTNGVYKIVNSPALFRNKGVLTVSMLDEILNLPEYPRSKRLSIVDLMKRFELCYDLEHDKSFLVPDLLPKDKPAELQFVGIPAFEYVYPVFTSKIITRFIVRMNQKIDDGLVWRTGVVLKIGENKALVKADIEDRKITIAIDGVEHTRRDALSAIRYQLDEIHNSIKGLDVQKRVPIPEAPNAEPLDYDYLLQLERDGFEEHPVKNGGRLVKVNVRKLLSGVVSEDERIQSAGNVTNIYVGGDISGGNIISGNENQANAEVSDKKPKKKSR